MLSRYFSAGQRFVENFSPGSIHTKLPLNFTMEINIDEIPFKGWKRNLRVTNGDVELIITLDVGPRILSYRKQGSASIFNIYEDHAGCSGESEWFNRGGHRLWAAPERRPATYFPDNGAVDWLRSGEHSVRVVAPEESSNGIRKEIEIALQPTGTSVRVEHFITRTGTEPLQLGAWALTVMAPRGIAFVPQPPVANHTRDVFPNRRWVAWPYTDLSDSRWHLGRHLITLKQDPTRGPTKIGFAQKIPWAGYLLRGTLFIKRFSWDEMATYPDNGCNFELFSNHLMVELESLGTLQVLHPGQTLSHAEHWEIYDGLPDDIPASEEALFSLIQDFIS